MGKPPEFPFLPIIASLTCGGGLWLLSLATNRHCAFGFGGFQCNAPLAGWGGLLLAAKLILLALGFVLLGVAAWRLLRRARQPRRRVTPPRS